ncbi:MAG: uroporphyrinogen decarboxylase family protein [Phycisphaerae bacterium]
MTRKEIVERAIRFNNPPRVPMKFDVVGVNDCYDVWTPDPTGWTWNFAGERADEWSCVWQRTEVQNTGQVVGHPLKDWAALKDYKWPDPDHPERYRDFEQQLAGAEDRFVMFCFGQGIFERLHMLHGMTETLMDFYRRPRQMHELIERILDHHLRMFHNCVRIAEKHRLKAGATRGLHAAAMADDWGLQDRAFISVQLFQEFFKPRYRRWFDEIRAAGLHPWMHSCGRINDILEELIDCGLEVINMQQPTVVGIDEISERFRGRICFESIVDTQSTLPSGTYDEIRSQAHELLEKWGTAQGGFIASDYNDAEAIGVTLDRRRMMFEAFAEKGGYPSYKQVLVQTSQARVGHSWGRATVK